MKNWKELSRIAARNLNLVDTETINAVLKSLADEAEQCVAEIIAANEKDLAAFDASNPLRDRLLLDEKRLAAIVIDIRNVAALPSPLGKTLAETIRPNGMKISKTSVPFGVVGVIYEARPNVTFDVFSLCFKSGNACVLKGGSDAQNSNSAIVNIIKSTLKRFALDENIITLLSPERESTTDLLNATGAVDVLIPRGGRGLIDFVRQNARVPVIETGAGVCHTFIDESANITFAENIVFNAKTRRVSVCNALDCLIVHEKILPSLPGICERLAEKNVMIYADIKAFTFLNGKYPAHLLLKADEESFGTEFLDYKMAVKTVSSIAAAIEHICKYGSQHSECIVSNDDANVALFYRAVDAACVYANVSTAFTDGAQFGLGAEIGISTQKLHARGPMALTELCTYKWLIAGEGQVRG
ncbi:MAG: glutamate-5-semialdehyde dehydrogenase [Paludibacter sp.]|jgi:glutamate-5-semialdehyde dehydrogenase|nr:glutamate-5-semialdehyde dehydrogenase [Paludibacter sp.]